MTVQTVLCESIGAKWGHGGLSEAKTKTKTEAKYKNQRDIRGLSDGYWRQFSRRFSRQLGMSFYRQSAEGAKNGVVDEQMPFNRDGATSIFDGIFI